MLLYVSNSYTYIKLVYPENVNLYPEYHYTQNSFYLYFSTDSRTLSVIVYSHFSQSSSVFYIPSVTNRITKVFISVSISHMLYIYLVFLYLPYVYLYENVVLLLNLYSLYIILLFTKILFYVHVMVI